MAKNTDHILLSIGSRKDYPPHEHLWCTMCGKSESLKLPDDIDIVSKRMTKFRHAHKSCISKKENDELLALGYVRVNDSYAWGGSLSIHQIASAVYGAVEIHLDGPYQGEFKHMHEADVVDAIRWLIKNPLAGIEQLFEAVGKMFKFPQTKPNNCWEQIRVCIFFDTARALINIGRGKK